MKRLFDEKEIKELYDDLVRRVHSGEQIEPLDRKMGIVTGHATDALELAKDVGHPLDLFELSEEQINTVILAMYMLFSERGESSTKCRETVYKKIGSYLFFTASNVCNENEKYEATPIMKGRSLYLELKDQTGKTIYIDTFSPVQRFVNNNLKYDKSAGMMTIRDPEKILKDIKDIISI